MNGRALFITGGTGYMGRHLIPPLLSRGHSVTALARSQSAARLPRACRIVIGDALDRSTFQDEIAPADTLVHLVGTSHPSPSKARLFREVDLRSARESVRAASAAGVRHFVYVSVAHPAPVMQAYTEARAEAEDLIIASGIPATILRPWYVLGPGHRWPYPLLPLFALLERLPRTRDTARRLCFVTIAQMVRTLVAAIESPAQGVRIVTAPEIRAARGIPQPGRQPPEPAAAHRR